jgi:hypothetical protein
MVGAITYGTSGIGAWRILQRTQGQQIEALTKEAAVQRATQHFVQNAEPQISAQDLVGDYQMLAVTLGAFGLEADQPHRAFIEKVLTSDLSDSRSLANRLSDKRYLRLAEAFQTGIVAGDPAVVEEIAQNYVRHQFEQRVGEGDDSLRLALNAKRELQAMSGRSSSNNTLWFEVMGNAPLRKVFETAFGFGSAYGQLSIDRQLEEFSAASERYLGSAQFADFTSDEGIERLVTLYLARGQISQSVQNRYSAALTLLGGA